jgi:hypothetical protein
LSLVFLLRHRFNPQTKLDSNALQCGMMLAETRKKQEEKADAASEAEPAPREGRELQRRILKEELSERSTSRADKSC